MITQSVEIKSRNIVIGMATYPVYENLQEALRSNQFDALEVLNRHVKAQAMSRERKRLTRKPQ